MNFCKGVTGIIFYLLCGAIIGSAFGQPGVIHYDTQFAFNKTIAAAGATLDTVGGYIKGIRTNSAVDTIDSQVFTLKQMKGGQDTYIHARRDTLNGVTADTAYLYIGVHRGPSYGGGAAWEWKELKMWGIDEGDAGIALQDSTWWNKAITDQFKFRFIETEGDSNRYWLDVFHYQTQR